MFLENYRYCNLWLFFAIDIDAKNIVSSILVAHHSRMTDFDDIWRKQILENSYTI